MASGASKRKPAQKTSRGNRKQPGKRANAKKHTGTQRSYKKADRSSKRQPEMENDPDGESASADKSQLTKEVRCLIALGITIFLTLCNFHICLGMGEGIYVILHGLMGCLAYLFPYFFLWAYLFQMANKGNVEAKTKLILSAVMLVLLCALLHLCSIRETQPFSLPYYFTEGQRGINGGLIGGLISGTLQHLIGSIGTLLIVIICMLIDVVLLTERSLVHTLRELTAQIHTSFASVTGSFRNRGEEDYEDEDYENYEDEEPWEPEAEERATASSSYKEDAGEEESSDRFAGDRPENSGLRSAKTVWFPNHAKKDRPRSDFLNLRFPFWDREKRKEPVPERSERSGAVPAMETASGSSASFSRTGASRETLQRRRTGQGRPVSSSSRVELEGENRDVVRRVIEPEAGFLSDLGFEELLSDFSGGDFGPGSGMEDFIVYNGLEESAENFWMKKDLQSAGAFSLKKDREFAEDFPMEEDQESAEDFPMEEDRESAEDFPMEKDREFAEDFSMEEDRESVEDFPVEEDLSSADGFPMQIDSEMDGQGGDPADPLLSGSEADKTGSDEEMEDAVDLTEHVILPEEGPLQRMPVSSGSETDDFPAEKPSAGASGRASQTDTARPVKSMTGKKLPPTHAPEESIWKKDTEANRGSSGAVTFGGKPKPPEKPKAKPLPYVAAPSSLLKRNTAFSGGLNRHHREIQDKLQETLKSFGVKIHMGNISVGPSVTRYELEPEPGVKVSRIVALQDDIKLALAAADIRIEAPIPGKSAIGIEVPNRDNTVVGFRELIESEKFKNHPSKLAVAVGRDISGQITIADLAKMPHLLIAGATGSGKSVCINTLIMSILYKATPDEVKLIMVDPKVVELSVYNGIPHLLVPVVTDPRKAANALRWAVDEMNDRYKKFAEYNVRNLEGFNAALKKIKEKDPSNEEPYLYQMVIIVDELADLMMVAPGEVEEAICRLAQMARAAGIHLVLATQRPSVNVITGLIKANVPSRIAFAVSSGVDSRTIIDMNGAEKLLGKGDMLFYPYGIPKPVRVQGAFISDEEVSRVVDYLQKHNGGLSGQEMMEQMITSASEKAAMKTEHDEYFEPAARFIIEKDKASIGALQRNFKIGFNRAARLMDQLAAAGVVGEEDSTKPRKILMNMDEFNQFLESE